MNDDSLFSLLPINDTLQLPCSKTKEGVRANCRRHFCSCTKKWSAFIFSRFSRAALCGSQLLVYPLVKNADATCTSYAFIMSITKWEKHFWCWCYNETWVPRANENKKQVNDCSVPQSWLHAQTAPSHWFSIIFFSVENFHFSFFFLCSLLFFLSFLPPFYILFSCIGKRMHASYPARTRIQL